MSANVFKETIDLKGNVTLSQHRCWDPTRYMMAHTTLDKPNNIDEKVNFISQNQYEMRTGRKVWS